MISYLKTIAFATIRSDPTETHISIMMYPHYAPNTLISMINAAIGAIPG